MKQERLSRQRDKILRSIRVENECWVWTKYIDPRGYAHTNIRVGDTSYYMAYRLAYVLFVGPIPAGLHIDHLCRNRACVNPAHLEAVPQRINSLRGVGLSALNARKTHCPAGHEYSPENTRVVQNPHGPGRQCRACQRERAKRARNVAASLKRTDHANL